jgi:hypothetical protein
MKLASRTFIPALRWVAGRVDAYTQWRPRWHYLLAILPPLLLFVYLCAFHVDLPYQDQWGTEWYRIERAMQGNLTLRDLWMQNSEHRPLFPSLIWIPLALATRWNILAEMLVSLALACLTFAMIVSQARHALSAVGVTRQSALVPLLSVAFFSLNQWENWLFGYSIQAFMHMCAVTLGLLLLAHPARRLWQLMVAALCALVATYSMFNGFVVWALGLVVLGFNTRRCARPASHLILWVLCAVATAVTYLYQYESPAHSPNLLSALLNPAGFALYVLTLLGSPVLTFYIAGIAGLIGVGLFAGCLVRLSGARFAPFTFFLALAGYAAGSALLIGVGRVGFGIMQSLSPRYVTYMLGFWLAIIVMLYAVAMLPAGTGAPVATSPRRPFPNAALGVIAAMAVLCCAGGFYLGYTIRYRPSAEARQAIVAGNASDAMLKRLYPDPAYVRTQLDALRMYRMSLYRDAQP